MDAGWLEGSSHRSVQRWTSDIQKKWLHSTNTRKHEINAIHIQRMGRRSRNDARHKYRPLIYIAQPHQTFHLRKEVVLDSGNGQHILHHALP